MDAPRRDNIEDALALVKDAKERLDTVANVLAFHARREDRLARNRLDQARCRRNAAIRNPQDAA